MRLTNNNNLRLYGFIENEKYILPYMMIVLDLNEIYNRKSYGI